MTCASFMAALLCSTVWSVISNKSISIVWNKFSDNLTVFIDFLDYIK